jgi:hypothetical protein
VTPASHPVSRLAYAQTWSDCCSALLLSVLVVFRVAPNRVQMMHLGSFWRIGVCFSSLLACVAGFCQYQTSLAL